MNRVESEANRMTALVEDLLLLARLDAGRPLAMSEVDLSRLTVDVVSDAHAAGPTITGTLELGEDPVTVSVTGRGFSRWWSTSWQMRGPTPRLVPRCGSPLPRRAECRLSVRDDGPGIPELMP